MSIFLDDAFMSYITTQERLDEIRDDIREGFSTIDDYNLTKSEREYVLGDEDSLLRAW